ncbi:ferritin-like domain-containing protein [Dyadobacter pollutisoli]|uniref:PA2169 family four-helix-bundle protein n=1 Tax=Dyadobacter pollutisoli TaxID=2910158 RepID=A0A9E8NBX2_9BACT|nr:PA2169 family four-helix-bundle protein [Dyadobacter pollutisoli]WAC13819.1 PA2169 family four-helix-bundle protein [Dyadobacter pollutisoli]
MSQNSEIIEVLNDLILINNDRVVGYEKAYDETDTADTDLRSLYNNLANHSRQHVSELTNEVNALGGEPATGTMVSGKLYRVWMDVKAAFSSDGRKTSLENSEFGEDAAQKAYESALKSENLTPDLRSLITQQKATLKTGHDTIKRLRDSEKVLH